MKRNPLLQSVVCTLAVVTLAACKQDDEGALQYINLSQVGCTFLSSGNEPLEITVETSPVQWKAEPSESWVTAKPGEDATTLILSVDDNDTEAERSATVTVTADKASQTITVYQLAADPSFNRYRKERMFLNGGVISPSGRYIGGFVNEAMPDNTYNYYPVIIDTETGDKTKLGPYNSVLFKCHQPFAISDNGQLFISDHENGGSIVFDLSGDYMLSSVPEGCKNRGSIMGVSADGSKWVGYASKEREEGERMSQYRPVIWENGEGRTLPMPEKNFKGQEFTVGAMARGISADGEIIYGTTWDNSDGAMIYWKNGQVKYVGHDVHEIKSVEIEDETFYYANGVVCQAEIYKISPSGNWIAGSYQKITVNPDDFSTVSSQCPAFYNTETEKTTILEEYAGSKGKFVTDDGIAFIHVPLGGGIVHDLNAGVTLGTVEEWVRSEYGIIIPPDIFITYVSPDGKVVLGTGTEMLVTGQGRIYPWYIIPPAQ